MYIGQDGKKTKQSDSDDKESSEVFEDEQESSEVLGGDDCMFSGYLPFTSKCLDSSF